MTWYIVTFIAGLLAKPIYDGIQYKRRNPTRYGRGYKPMQSPLSRARPGGPLNLH